jgi:uncharacterized protein YbaR (Trm112 family)
VGNPLGSCAYAAHWDTIIHVKTITPLSFGAVHLTIEIHSLGMTFPDWMMEILRCPRTGGKLTLASPELLARLQEQAKLGQLSDAMGRTVSELPSQGLLSENARWLYLVDDGIPTLMAEEAISIDS